MSQYSQTIRKWAVDTRRAGCLADADGTGEIGLEASTAGKRLAARFTLKLEHDRVADARYEVFGCGFSMAACAVAADLVIGQSLNMIHKIDAQRLDNALEGLPADRRYCADLAVDALQAAAASARNGSKVVASALTREHEEEARVTLEDPVYSQLMQSLKPGYVSSVDRHLFACLVAVAAKETHDIPAALGLKQGDLDFLFSLYFPGQDRESLKQHSTSGSESAPQGNKDVLSLLLKYTPTGSGGRQAIVSSLFCEIIATRASLPGHLWVAMGLTERPQLTAAIRRHLPALAAANNKNMRWKRFLYKQVCDANGGSMCKTPNCGECSDYHLCFTE